VGVHSLTGARRRVARAVTTLRFARFTLQRALEQLPLPPAYSDKADLPADVPVEVELGRMIQCGIADHLSPLIEALERAIQ
jgi:hypothetical protein